MNRIAIFGIKPTASDKSKLLKLFGLTKAEFVEASRVVLSEPVDLGNKIQLRLAVEIGQYNGTPHSARASVELPKSPLLEEYLQDMSCVPPVGSPSRPGWYPLTVEKGAFLLGETTDVEIDGVPRKSTPILKSIINGLEKAQTTIRVAEVIEATL